MGITTNNPPKSSSILGCLGALVLFFGLFIALGVLSGEIKNDLIAQWILVALLLALGGAGIFGAWKLKKKEKAARPIAQAAPTVGRPAPPGPSPAGDQPSPMPGEVRCPSCGNMFTPPRIMLVTEAVTRRYGPNPVQCPQCHHIWGRT